MTDPFQPLTVRDIPRLTRYFSARGTRLCNDSAGAAVLWQPYFQDAALANRLTPRSCWRSSRSKTSRHCFAELKAKLAEQAAAEQAAQAAAQERRARSMTEPFRACDIPALFFHTDVASRIFRTRRSNWSARCCCASSFPVSAKSVIAHTIFS